MSKDRNSDESVEKAFSSYVKSSLQHASSDYFKKLFHDYSHIALLDAVTYELNISLNICPMHLQEENDHTLFTQVIEDLQLSPKEKKIFCLKYCEDKTDKEIASSMGVTRQAISKTKSNILVKLKSHLEMHS
ncbi:sigma-70 family RNA polymerase sigma factor [Paenibacillus sp. S150]|uniref:sigma-70 family RNA polymerase sigma factor n=1 Tax=Paenibacillus sp. S150 TaxID=2749826 RepID=UPI001C58506B|nr:sigma-70 family RNA polymerase sigma factor [Paenibacillus sp. S150]MBW4084450.1 sigma-70 family RNA polymerase sigma factor [Paenibacillus sp. S150]